MLYCLETMTQKNPQDQGQPEPQFNVRELYNVMMYEIEPDLITDIIPHLDEIYKGETEKQTQQRRERYVKAFEVFFRRFRELTDTWEQEMVSLQEDLQQQFGTQEEFEEALKKGSTHNPS